ncbi:MAG: purine-binding chemotaxis protein CheW [Deltaproteobacteria bacterium]|nr:purine-binding chemotaxis protein CheW [Deltaproteobacteria bacterium]
MAQTVERTGFSSGTPQKFLTFALAGEEYGITIMKIKEIIGMMPVTVLPQTPAYVKGVINLRGKVIPIIDLRLKFALEYAAPSERTCIIVVETEDKENRQILVGLIIDAVSEVISLKGDEVEAAPKMQSQFKEQLILGLAKCENGVKILLDIDKVINHEELVGIDPEIAV